jgi:hypothetical protein
MAAAPPSQPQPSTRYLTLAFLLSTHNVPITFLSCRLPTPNRLQEPIALRQSVQAIVTLGAASHEAAECIDLVLARITARFVHFADAYLDGGMVFGFDDAVRSRALSGDVAVVRREASV